MTPRVTILIAAYNAAGFIRRAIGSAQAQTESALEILVVDDASTDETRDVVTALAAEDSRIRLVFLAVNGGPGGARNAGLDAARGDWVAVLDADDAFTPDRLARLLATAEAEGADLVADNFRLYDAATATAGPPVLADEPPVQIADARRFVARSQTGADDWGLLKPMFRRAFLDTHGLRYDTSSRHGEDFLFVLSILLAGGRYAVINEAGYLYTTRASGFSRTQIDYRGMADKSRALLRLPHVAADRELTRLVRLRAEALDRVHSQRETGRLIAARDAFGLLRLAARDGEARRQICLRLAKRLRR